LLISLLKYVNDDEKKNKSIIKEKVQELPIDVFALNYLNTGY